MSKEIPTKYESSPMFSNLSILYKSYDTANICNSLLATHNLGNSSEQIIDNLRNKITSQQLYDEIDNSIEYSNKQYKYIVLI